MEAVFALPSVVALALAVAAPAADRPDARDLVREMAEVAAALRGYTMTIVKQDTGGGALGPEIEIAAAWTRPGRFELRFVRGPGQGREVVYAPDTGDPKLRVRMGTFPWLRLGLDPFGGNAMKDQLHPITETSLVFFVETVAANVALAQGRGEGVARVAGEEDFDDRPCWKVEMEAPGDGVEHVLAAGETLWDVARRHGQSIAPILQANRGLGWRQIGDARPGQRVFVPRYYAGRIEMWISKDLKLPLKALIYDARGNLFERFEHRGLRVEARP
jgi:LysM repeat protein